MPRQSSIERKTNETGISISIDLDRVDKNEISTGIPFFDHMLSLFSAHGLFDLSVVAKGDIEIDFHHTVEDVGLVLGNALNEALGTRKGIRRYGHAVIPMDEALAAVSIDLSNRPFLVYNVPDTVFSPGEFDVYLAKEFVRAFSTRGGMNLHINVSYGENEHHIIESIFKALGRALNMAVSKTDKMNEIPSTKGVL